MPYAVKQVILRDVWSNRTTTEKEDAAGDGAAEKENKDKSKTKEGSKKEEKEAKKDKGRFKKVKNEKRKKKSQKEDKNAKRKRSTKQKLSNSKDNAGFVKCALTPPTFQVPDINVEDLEPLFRHEYHPSVFRGIWKEWSALACRSLLGMALLAQRASNPNVTFWRSL